MLLECSPKFTEDDLISLETNIPTDDEYKVVKDYVGSSSEKKRSLGKPEEFVRQMVGSI